MKRAFLIVAGSLLLPATRAAAQDMSDAAGGAWKILSSIAALQLRAGAHSAAGNGGASTCIQSLKD